MRQIPSLLILTFALQALGCEQTSTAESTPSSVAAADSAMISLLAFSRRFEDSFKAVPRGRSCEVEWRLTVTDESCRFLDQKFEQTPGFFVSDALINKLVSHGVDAAALKKMSKALLFDAMIEGVAINAQVLPNYVAPTRFNQSGIKGFEYFFRREIGPVTLCDDPYILATVFNHPPSDAIRDQILIDIYRMLAQYCTTQYQPYEANNTC